MTDSVFDKIAGDFRDRLFGRQDLHGLLLDLES
jgi:hypothetical protein